ncbi:hypothetical protein HDU76_004578 [Blyttiomyces sp. JEL0837]|nr:hypothetical protein HDU76_004578 [Blyttiomyces sp. JEL0837]
MQKQQPRGMLLQVISTFSLLLNNLSTSSTLIPQATFREPLTHLIQIGIEYCLEHEVERNNELEVDDISKGRQSNASIATVNSVGGGGMTGNNAVADIQVALAVLVHGVFRCVRHDPSLLSLLWSTSDHATMTDYLGPEFSSSSDSEASQDQSTAAPNSVENNYNTSTTSTSKQQPAHLTRRQSTITNAFVAKLTAEYRRRDRYFRPVPKSFTAFEAAQELSIATGSAGRIAREAVLMALRLAVVPPNSESTRKSRSAIKSGGSDPVDGLLAFDDDSIMRISDSLALTSDFTSYLIHYSHLLDSMVQELSIRFTVLSSMCTYKRSSTTSSTIRSSRSDRNKAKIDSATEEFIEFWGFVNTVVSLELSMMGDLFCELLKEEFFKTVIVRGLCQSEKSIACFTTYTLVDMINSASSYRFIGLITEVIVENDGLALNAIVDHLFEFQESTNDIVLASCQLLELLIRGGGPLVLKLLLGSEATDDCKNARSHPEQVPKQFERLLEIASFFEGHTLTESFHRNLETYVNDAHSQLLNDAAADGAPLAKLPNPPLLPNQVSQTASATTSDTTNTAQSQQQEQSLLKSGILGPKLHRIVTTLTSRPLRVQLVVSGLLNLVAQRGSLAMLTKLTDDLCNLHKSTRRGLMPSEHLEKYINHVKTNLDTNFESIEREINAIRMSYVQQSNDDSNNPNEDKKPSSTSSTGILNWFFNSGSEASDTGTGDSIVTTTDTILNPITTKVNQQSIPTTITTTQQEVLRDSTSGRSSLQLVRRTSSTVIKPHQYSANLGIPSETFGSLIILTEIAKELAAILLVRFVDTGDRNFGNRIDLNDGATVRKDSELNSMGEEKGLEFWDKEFNIDNVAVNNDNNTTSHSKLQTGTDIYPLQKKSPTLTKSNYNKDPKTTSKMDSGVVFVASFDDKICDSVDIMGSDVGKIEGGEESDEEEWITS